MLGLVSGDLSLIGPCSCCWYWRMCSWRKSLWPHRIDLSADPRRVVEGSHQVRVEPIYFLETSHCAHPQATMRSPNDVLVAGPRLPEPDTFDPRRITLVMHLVPHALPGRIHGHSSQDGLRKGYNCSLVGVAIDSEVGGVSVRPNAIPRGKESCVDHYPRP